MPFFRIHMINSNFESSEESEYASLDAAKKSATGSAIKVAAENLAEGEETSAVHLRIEENDRTVAHYVVNLSVSPLLPDA